MIFTLNTAGYLFYPVAKDCLGLNDNEVYDMINCEFSIMLERLKNKGIKYDELKKALIPNQDKDNQEVCLIFDTCQIDSDFYGYTVFEKLIPLMNKESTYSILYGDYINISNISQNSLFGMLQENLIAHNETIFNHSTQYYLVYINNVTKQQLSSFINGLKEYKWFAGYALLNHHSRFKTYLSHILIHLCIKSQSSIIMSHAEDIDDDENINHEDFPFEENGFRVISINEQSFGPFLSYKIESLTPDKEDVSFSFNALFQKFDSVEKLKLKMTDPKWGYLNDEVNGKGNILKSFIFEEISKDDFISIVYAHISRNYIYNLRINEYGDYLFNVCIELPTKHLKFRKTTIALKYKPYDGEMEIITIT